MRAPKTTLVTLLVVSSIERRMQVFEELKKVEGLTDMERKDQSAVDFCFYY